MKIHTHMIDVLLVLERAAWEIDADPRDGLPGRSLDEDKRRELAGACDEARDAVDELISAARDAATILQEKAGPLEQETPHRLWVALARIGGAA